MKKLCNKRKKLVFKSPALMDVGHSGQVRSTASEVFGDLLGPGALGTLVFLLVRCE